MKKAGRYSTSKLIEDQFEPGSNGRVLRNLLGITSKREMDRIETAAYMHVTDKLIEEYDRGHRFASSDICYMHKQWLGSIYKWAGCYRNVMMSKGDFPFASPAYIPRLMEDFERDILHQYTPCTFDATEKVIEALATVHTELVLIHPFREGNGRIARLLSVLMAFQAELPYLDFSSIQRKKKEEYFAAVRAGLDRNYKPMEKVFSEVISRTSKKYKQN